MRPHTRSRLSWNSALVKKGSPRAAHSLLTYPCVCRLALQLTVPPPPHAWPATMLVLTSSELMNAPFMKRWFHPSASLIGRCSGVQWYAFSTTSTRLPASARFLAHTPPPHPLPTTTTSVSMTSGFVPGGICTNSNSYPLPGFIPTGTRGTPSTRRSVGVILIHVCLHRTVSERCRPRRAPSRAEPHPAESLRGRARAVR